MIIDAGQKFLQSRNVLIFLKLNLTIFPKFAKVCRHHVIIGKVCFEKIAIEI